MFFSEDVPKSRNCPHLESGDIKQHFQDIDPRSEFYGSPESRFKGDTAEVLKH